MNRAAKQFVPKPALVTAPKAVSAAGGNHCLGAALANSAAAQPRRQQISPALSAYFLPYQAAWIQDKSRLKVAEKGRQEGFTYADSYDSVVKAGVKGQAADVWVCSRDEVAAKEYIRDAKFWANILQYAAEDMGEQMLDISGGKAISVQVLRFATGCCIYALSSNPDALAGKHGHVKLDEFALHKDQRQLYAIAKPVTQWGGTLSVFSTHRGIGTVFYQIIDIIKHGGNPMGWSLHTVPIELAVKQGLVEKIDQAGGKAPLSDPAAIEARRAAWLAQQRAECIDEEQWQQEYCCVASDEGGAFISYEMISACEEASLRLMDMAHLTQKGPVGASHRQFYLGVDVARKKDLCVLDLGEKVGDVMRDIARLELLNKTFAEIRFDLYRLLQLPELVRCCIDATGMGMQLAEEAHQQFGWKVEPVTFTGAVKEELAFGLREDFEDKRLRLVRDAKRTADIRGIKKETTLNGNIRFVGDSEDSHCDRFWALALRQQAARSKRDIGACVG